MASDQSSDPEIWRQCWMRPLSRFNHLIRTHPLPLIVVDSFSSLPVTTSSDHAATLSSARPLGCRHLRSLRHSLDLSTRGERESLLLFRGGAAECQSRLLFRRTLRPTHYPRQPLTMAGPIWRILRRRLQRDRTKRQENYGGPERTTGGFCVYGADSRRVPLLLQQ